LGYPSGSGANMYTPECFQKTRTLFNNNLEKQITNNTNITSCQNTTNYNLSTHEN
jgi:hypothetical protein